MIPPIKVPEYFRIIAHRGASAYTPENTAAAFKLAADMQVKEFELDTQLTSDGVVVICHDITLERYGYDGQVVEETDWEKLSRLDMGSWFSPFFYRGEKMLRLTDLFGQYQGAVTYHVEIKGNAPKLPAFVCKTIQEFNLESNCIVTSFSYESLLVTKAANPYLRLGWLVERIDSDTLVMAQKAGFFQICPRANKTTPESVSRAHELLPEVRSWGLEGGNQQVLSLVQNVIDSGCDGMTINWPDWVSH